MKKNRLESFLKVGTDDSLMRLMSIRAVNTACFVAIMAILGVVSGLILGILSNRDLTVITSIIGALLGGAAGMIGTLLVPAFGGKVAQSKFEINGADNKVNSEKIETAENK